MRINLFTNSVFVLINLYFFSIYLWITCCLSKTKKITRNLHYLSTIYIIIIFVWFKIILYLSLARIHKQILLYKLYSRIHIIFIIYKKNVFIFSLLINFDQKLPCPFVFGNKFWCKINNEKLWLIYWKEKISEMEQ